MSGLTAAIDEMGFEELDKNIRITMRRSAKDAVQLGYMLRRVLDEQLWAESYDTYDDYLQQGLHMDYTVATRFIGINKKYSFMGRSMDIKEEYLDYSQSLLVEMLNLPPELEEKVTPETTVREIRQMKKESRKKPESCIQDPAVLEEKVIDGEYREIEAPHDERWFTEQYIKHFPEDLTEFLKICREQKNNGDRAKAIQRYKAPYGYSGSHCIDYDFTFHGFPAGMDFRVGEETLTMKYGRFVKELLALHDPFKDEKVATPQDAVDEREEQQPELPILKNNDQRKEWLDNYKEWGLWYWDENIDVNYYKFDFADGTRLIATEYPQRERYYCKGQEDEVYYHLLKKNKKAHSYNGTYDEKYRQHTDSITELVEFLKDLQRKRGKE